MKQVETQLTPCSPPVDGPTYAVMVCLRQIRLSQVPEKLRDEVYTLLRTVFCPECG